jgi:transcriptional regulator with GAF, ATPase, and Fis domain
MLDALRSVLAQVAEPNAVLRAILDQSLAATGAERGLVVEVHDRGELEYAVLHQIERPQLEGEAGRFSRQLFQEVIAKGEAIVLDDALEHSFYESVASFRALKARAIACFPIRVEGRVAAIVHLEHRNSRRFVGEDLKLMQALSELAEPVLQTLQASREVLREREQLRLRESRYRGEAETSREWLASDWSFARFVGHSAPVRELERQVMKAAATAFPALILGETGTGKGIVARVLHYAGPRAAGPLVTVFCPTLERGMVEAELFGHRRGAFTGALTDRIGKVQAAEGGSLFLDEIGELSLDIQTKLLRLLQERTFERVGDSREMHADVRVLAATNRDLDEEVAAGRFRRDLLERLRFLPLRIPPLRERREDIPLLLRASLDQGGGRWIELSDDAMDYLGRLDFTWPGNVRHIEQLAARLLTDPPERAVKREDLERLLDGDATRKSSRRTDGAPADLDLEDGLPMLLEESERHWLEEALRRFPAATRAELAARLRISESALYKKLRHHGLSSG